MAIDLSSYQAVLLDLDGTLYAEDEALPGAAALIDRFIARNQPFACITNSTLGPRHIAERLKAMSIRIEESHIHSAAAAACEYVVDKFGPGARVFNLATSDVEEMLAGRATFVEGKDEPCDAIIVGAPANDRAGWARQRVALQLARRGALVVGICRDRVYPSPYGMELGTGSQTQMLTYAADSEAVYTGKPDKLFFKALFDATGFDPKRCVLIGDNAESDMRGAKPLGIKTVLVLTGVTRREKLNKLAEGDRPDEVVDDLNALS